MLKKGDPCYVRLFGGDIVKAKYDSSINDGRKRHWVILESGKYGLVDKKITDDLFCDIPDCRFVCMTGINGKDNEARD